MLNIDEQAVMTRVASDIVKDSFKGAWLRVKKYFKDVSAKESIEYGHAFERYLENTEMKYRKIKTLIYRRTPKDLYSFYESIGVLYNGKIIDTNSIDNLVVNENKIIITGTGGVGKSTLLKHLYLNTVEETSMIPIMIELRTVNSIDIKDISLCDMVYRSLVDNGFKLEQKYFEHSMQNGGYIILLDGYDEVNRERSQKVALEIQSLCSKYNENKYIISSRPIESFIGWNDFAEMITLPLSKKQALSLIGKIEFDNDVKDNFMNELEDSLYENYESFASNPLLLTIMLMTYDSHASIPDKLNEFYENAFATLFNMHDATKGGSYTRDIRSALGCEDFKLVFSHLCFKSYFNGEYEFTETRLHKYIKDAKEKTSKNKFRIEDFQDDLLFSVCMIVKEGLNYSFSHRSFQEYFAALYTCKLPDTVQEKLLTGWIKETGFGFYNMDSYFTMLFNMQSDKVNLLVLCPVIKLLKIEYEKYGFSIDLLERLFQGLRVQSWPKVSSEASEFTLSLTIKNSYLCYALVLTCRLNEYSYESKDDEDVAELLYQSMQSNTVNNTVSIEKAVDIVGEKRLLQSLEWTHSQMMFCFSILEKYTGTNVSRKRRVASILEGL